MTDFGEKVQQKEEETQRERARHGEALYQQGILCHSQGDLANAEKAYREAISTGYSNYALFSNLGVICKNKKRGENFFISSLYRKYTFENF